MHESPSQELTELLAKTRYLNFICRRYLKYTKWYCRLLKLKNRPNAFYIEIRTKDFKLIKHDAVTVFNTIDFMTVEGTVRTLTKLCLDYYVRKEYQDIYEDLVSFKKPTLKTTFDTNVPFRSRPSIYLYDVTSTDTWRLTDMVYRPDYKIITKYHRPVLKIDKWVCAPFHNGHYEADGHYPTWWQALQSQGLLDDGTPTRVLRRTD